MSGKTQTAGLPGSLPSETPREPYEQLRIDMAGNVQTRNDDPATTTGSAQVTGGGTTTTTILSGSLAGAVLATSGSLSITTAGAPGAGTVNVIIGGTTVATLAATAAGTTTWSTIKRPVDRDAGVTVSVSSFGGTATVNVTAFTISREDLWKA